MSSVIWDGLRIRAENSARKAALERANREQIAASLQVENNHWLKVLREQPEMRERALDELDRIRILGRAS